MMKTDYLKEQLLSMVGEIHPEDGVDPEVIRHQDKSGKHVKDRKMRGLCKQIRQAIDLTLPEDLNLVTLAVIQGADPSHVIVILQRIDDHISLSTAEFLLSKWKDALVGAVRFEITRKRVPSLTFRISPEVLYTKE